MSKVQSVQLRKLTLAAVFAAIIVVFTVVPYTGYINYGVIEITTLHIVTILGAVFLGWKYGAVLGGVWGVTCLVRAYTNPIFLTFHFGNPLVSVVPRILVGLVAGAVFTALSKTKLNTVVSAIITAVVGTLTNTVLVLSAMNFFSGSEFYETFKSILGVVISVNGVIEIAAAVVIVPLIYKPLSKQKKLLFRK